MDSSHLSSTGVELTVLVPVYNEAESLPGLYTRLIEVLEGAQPRYRDSFELLIVDDGSQDSSAEVYGGLIARDPRVRAIRFRRNFGKTAALHAGFTHCRGESVVTIDADLQEDPVAILEMLALLDRGYDLVSGWRRPRRDPPDKVWPSLVFNTVVASITGVGLHDINCGFKAYRRVLLREIPMYGDMHRFTPVLARQRGFRITEIPVTHQPRRFGRSKFGAGRLSNGYLDFVEVLYLISFSRQPFRLFGLVGSAFVGVSLAAIAYLVVLWLMGQGPIGNRPLLFFSILGVLSGLQFLSIGLLGSMLRNSRPDPASDYSISQIYPNPDRRQDD